MTTPRCQEARRPSSRGLFRQDNLDGSFEGKSPSAHAGQVAHQGISAPAVSATESIWFRSYLPFRQAQPAIHPQLAIREPTRCSS